MKKVKVTSTILVALMATALAWVLQGKRRHVRVPERTALRLVEREGRPWIHWESPVASGVIFQMEADGRFETIGVAEDAAHEHVVELAGWLGSSEVSIHVRPDEGKPPAPLRLAPGTIEAYLDRLAAGLLSGRNPDAWARLGRFSGLYFSSGRGDAELKRRLQARLVERGREAGPGGARWLWGESSRPRRVSGLPGAPRKIAAPAIPGNAGPGEPGMALELPGVRAEKVELEVRVEVSPTPARDFHLIAELDSGWKVRLEPGPEGGLAFQRLDGRALREEGTGCLITVHAGPEAPEGLRVALVESGLRFLPEAPEHAQP